MRKNQLEGVRSKKIGGVRASRTQMMTSSQLYDVITEPAARF